MPMTPREYDKMQKESSPPTRSGRTLPMAFAVGGLICVLGQAITGGFLAMGLPEEEARTWCSVTLIFLSVVTTGLGGVFPADLLVGVVQELVPEVSGKSTIAVIKPGTDPRTVRHAFIITSF